MAKTTKHDELNIIDFFGEMNLSEEEINERIAMAQQLKDLYHRVFVIVKADLRLENDIDAEYIEDMLTNGYNDLFDTQNGFVKERVDKIVPEVVDTTLKHLNDEYYLSDERAKIIAVNDVNAIFNNAAEERAISEGYKYKVWETLRDNRVRHTHILADGQRVKINEMFVVGLSEMRFPMDSENGAPEETINCRCVCKYQK